MVKKTAKERQLERDMAALQKQLSDMQAEKLAAEEQAQAEAKDKARMAKKYVSALATVGARKNAGLEKNQGMIMQIKKVTKKKLWQRVKFIGNDKQLRKAALLVLEMLGIEDYTHKEGESEARKIQVDTNVEEWLATYSTDVRAAINDQRSYFQSEAKKIALTWLKEGKTLPPPKEFEKIAMRDLEDEDGVEVAEKVQVFDMYLLMISACAGSATYGDKLRRTEPVSTAPTSEGKLAVPSGIPRQWSW